jgi:hypothetical protein
MTSTSPLNF